MRFGFVSLMPRVGVQVHFQAVRRSSKDAARVAADGLAASLTAVQNAEALIIIASYGIPLVLFWRVHLRVKFEFRQKRVL